MPTLISLKISTARPSVPTSSSSGTPSSESASLSSSPTFPSRAWMSGARPRSSIGPGLYIIPPRGFTLGTEQTPRMLSKRWLHPIPDLRLRPLLRNPLYGLHEVLDQVLGGAVPVGALLDEVLEQQVVYPADGGEDRVGLLHDLSVGDVPLLDHLRDPPHVSLHALEAPYDLVFVLPLQTPLPLPLIEFFQQLPDHRGVVEGHVPLRQVLDPLVPLACHDHDIPLARRREGALDRLSPVEQHLGSRGVGPRRDLPGYLLRVLRVGVVGRDDAEVGETADHPAHLRALRPVPLPRRPEHA